MDSGKSDRERLTTDLELLGVLANPSRGPLASVYAPPQPNVESNAGQVRPIGTWRRMLMAALARFEWNLTTQPAPAQRPIEPRLHRGGEKPCYRASLLTE